MASDSRPSTTVWTEGQRPEPVSPEHPLVGLETLVLRTWLENSPTLRKAYRASPRHRLDVENAVRLRVAQTYEAELKLRAEQGYQQHEAEEFTRPAMWTPPT